MTDRACCTTDLHEEHAEDCSLGHWAAGWDNGAHIVNNELRVPLPKNPDEYRLLTWWLNTALCDFNATVPKMLEYGGGGAGSADLQVMGDAQAELIDMHDADDAVKQELGVWFYALGKIARLISDYKNKRAGKADTWFDLTIYAMMARRIQEYGKWPG